MAPGEQAVEVADLGVELVVALGADGDHAVAAQSFDVDLEGLDHAVGNFLAVADVEGEQIFFDAGSDVDGGDHEGAEVIALPRLIDADPSQRRAARRRGFADRGRHVYATYHRNDEEETAADWIV